ncbi:MAG: DUF975 family protein [Clostridia bacterium]|nr:DUF975 family protein [Clostridia bacterium]
MNRAELKSKAKQQIKGKIGILFVITLVIGVVSAVVGFVLGLIPYVGPIAAAIIVTPAFALSIVRVYLMVVAGKTPEVKDAFCGFDDFWSAFKVTFLVSLYTFLWSLLFVIPGIIKSFAYSMSFYILAENPGKSARECIKESVDMTNGHKGELFVLSLSFIGWELLGCITFGIAYIWVVPYVYATYVNVYHSLKPVVNVSAEPEVIDETAE